MWMLVELFTFSAVFSDTGHFLTFLVRTLHFHFTSVRWISNF